MKLFQELLNRSRSQITASSKMDHTCGVVFLVVRLPIIAATGFLEHLETDQCVVQPYGALIPRMQQEDVPYAKAIVVLMFLQKNDLLTWKVWLHLARDILNMTSAEGRKAFVIG